MPLIRLSVPAAMPMSKARALADSVHQSLVETCAVPPDDCFQLIAHFAPEAMVLHPTFPDVQRTPEASVIEILFIEGRSPAQKNALFQRITERAGEAGFVADDLLIGLSENSAADWCAGQGRAFAG